MNAARRSTDRLADILEAIFNARSDIGNQTLSDFLADGKSQRAVIESLMVIGEASKRLLGLAPELETEFPDVAVLLREANDMRNLLAHEYFRVDPEIIWTTVKIDLPELEAAMHKLSASFSQP